MDTYILSCKKCNRMYKALNKEGNYYITDFGDKLSKCFCGGEFSVSVTEDWIADKVFTVKGERIE